MTIADQIVDLAARWSEQVEKLQRNDHPTAARTLRACIHDLLALQPADSPQAIPAEVLEAAREMLRWSDDLPPAAGTALRLLARYVIDAVAAAAAERGVLA